MPLRLLLFCFALVLVCCSSDDSIAPPVERNFSMGFTTWPYGPNLQDVDDTYDFIEDNSDLYTEHFDNKIPWKAWMNNTPLPTEFTNEVQGRANRRIDNHELLLSVSLLNLSREELAEDFDGTIPDYTNLDDPEIENAYFKHIEYLVSSFSPEYLVIAIEVNELRLRAESKWDSYQRLIQNVKARIKVIYPNLPISESVSLHNLYEADIPNSKEYISDMISHMNQLDFAAISYYPFLKNQQSIDEFQRTFEFLHSNVSRPIAFSESGHIAEDLIIPNLNVSIPGNETEQNVYLETLLKNAEEQNYMFITWWAYRDYDALWETFPDEVKDIGQIWRDTGLLDESGNERESSITWASHLAR